MEANRELGATDRTIHYSPSLIFVLLATQLSAWTPSMRCPGVKGEWLAAREI
jgi:hypothetical protein